MDDKADKELAPPHWNNRKKNWIQIRRLNKIKYHEYT